jgi:hypothetical protein
VARELAEGFLDILRRGITGHPQSLVVVLELHAGSPLTSVGFGASAQIGLRAVLIHGKGVETTRFIPMTDGGYRRYVTEVVPINLNGGICHVSLLVSP